MKKFFIISILVLLCIFSSIPFTYASSTTVISLSDSKITVNGETISTDTSGSVYLSSQMDNGGTSNDATSSNIAISNIININSSGTYEFSGTLTDGQISINANNIIGEGGTYNIQSLDDWINACRESESAITINGGAVIVNILDDADEGDGIDSNGYIYINGGTVYAFAHPGSDNGLDSDLGTYINGGTVFTSGSMYKEAKTTNDTQIIQMNFLNGVNAGESIVIVDENNNVIFAFKADRKISTVVYSSSDLTGQTYSVYSGTNISGTVDDNNIYTSIESIDLSNMSKQENNTMNNRGPGRPGNFRNTEATTSKSNIVIKYVIIGVLITIIIFIIGITIFSFTKKK